MNQMQYLLLAPMILVAIAVAGLVNEKHFVVLLLGVELIFLSSTLIIGYAFSALQAPDPSGVMALIAVWSAAAAEVIALIAFYIYMKSSGVDFDVTKLSRLRG